MSPTLAILIPHLTERKKLLDRLLSDLDNQIKALPNPDDVKILISEDQGQARLGTKRNELISKALELGAESIAFFDDDDRPGKTYITQNLKGIKDGFDCCSLWGQIYFAGVPGKPFHHSLIHKTWHEDSKYYYRMPNHLNAIRLSLVKDILFYPQNFGEDGRWSNDIRDKGVLKTEFQIDDILYHYFTGSRNWKLESV